MEITFGRPGLAGVSSDDSDGSFVGLHIDDWDSLPILERQNSRVLFCANLGVDPRYFMYLDVTVDVMAAKLEALRRVDYMQCHPDQIVSEYLDAFPDHPVVALKMEPYDAYIAPIQNVVHEGSTMGAQWPDVQIMLLGRQEPPATATHYDRARQSSDRVDAVVN